ncbi:MAG: hypothetical protein ACE5FA_11815 [Dehalococcoidia bacterium]
MNKGFFVILALGLAGVLAACGDDSAPADDDRTSLVVEKSVASEGNGEFRFTLRLTNDGDAAATNVVFSDVWQDGLNVTEVGDFGGLVVDQILDIGIEILLDEFPAGESGELVYRATCVAPGQWTNAATVTASNADSASDSVSVSCP